MKKKQWHRQKKKSPNQSSPSLAKRPESGKPSNIENCRQKTRTKHFTPGKHCIKICDSDLSKPAKAKWSAETYTLMRL